MGDIICGHVATETSGGCVPRGHHLPGELQPPSAHPAEEMDIVDVHSHSGPHSHESET